MAFLAAVRVTVASPLPEEREQLIQSASADTVQSAVQWTSTMAVATARGADGVSVAGRADAPAVAMAAVASAVTRRTLLEVVAAAIVAYSGAVTGRALLGAIHSRAHALAAIAGFRHTPGAVGAAFAIAAHALLAAVAPVALARTAAVAAVLARALAPLAALSRAFAVDTELRAVARGARPHQQQRSSGGLRLVLTLLRGLVLLLVDGVVIIVTAAGSKCAYHGTGREYHRQVKQMLFHSRC